jgi:hypothetical protein
LPLQAAPTLRLAADPRSVRQQADMLRHMHARRTRGGLHRRPKISSLEGVRGKHLNWILNRGWLLGRILRERSGKVQAESGPPDTRRLTLDELPCTLLNQGLLQNAVGAP